MTSILRRYQSEYHAVVAFDIKKDKLLPLDLTAANRDIDANLVNDTSLFSDYISNSLKTAGARYGIGGYNEHRTVYSRSVVFDGEKSGEEPRRLHLGTDIWGPEDTPVFAPLDGKIHSFNYNDSFGDYGATIILSHHLDDLSFCTLYGHLSLKDIAHLTEGQQVISGQEIAHFGPASENGNWPPHLHFQLIFDLGNNRGDYPGVCRYSERDRWLKNSPDPDLILQMNRYI